MDGTINTVAAFLALSGAGYGASQGKLSREFEDTRASLIKFGSELDNIREARRKYQQLLSRLRCDDLIETKKTRGLPERILLTVRGEKKLAALRTEHDRFLPSIQYQHTRASVITIITFDVPEKERRKRDWLRRALQQLGFRFIQQSVCIGKIRLPKLFLKDLRSLQLLDDVEIFQVTRTGSLRRFTNTSTAHL